MLSKKKLWIPVILFGVALAGCGGGGGGSDSSSGTSSSSSSGGSQPTNKVAIDSTNSKTVVSKGLSSAQSVSRAGNMATNYGSPTTAPKIANGDESGAQGVAVATNTLITTLLKKQLPAAGHLGSRATRQTTTVNCDPTDATAGTATVTYVSLGGGTQTQPGDNAEVRVEYTGCHISGSEYNGSFDAVFASGWTQNGNNYSYTLNITYSSLRAKELSSGKLLWEVDGDATLSFQYQDSDPDYGGKPSFAFEMTGSRLTMKYRDSNDVLQTSVLTNYDILMEFAIDSGAGRYIFKIDYDYTLSSTELAGVINVNTERPLVFSYYTDGTFTWDTSGKVVVTGDNNSTATMTTTQGTDQATIATDSNGDGVTDGTQSGVAWSDLGLSF